MEKQLSTIGYWLGLICTVLALIFRIFLAFGINLFACCWRHCHFLLGFLSRCRAVFLTDDRELVPDGKAKACRPELLTR